MKAIFQTEPVGSARARDAWVDVSKAFCIILVVYHHAAYLHTPGMKLLDKALTFYRMPMFFFVSGLYIGKMLRYDGAALIAFRLAPLAYLYVIWSAIKWVFVDGIGIIKGQSGDVLYLITGLWHPMPTLWFLYALVLFSGLAWSFRAIPPFAVSIIAAAAALAAAYFGPIYDGDFIYKAGRFFVWFWLGHICRPYVARIIELQSKRSFLLVVPVWLAITYALVATGMDLRWYAIPLSATAIIAGCIFALAISSSLVVTVASLLGRNTLPIYVGHFLPLLLLQRLPLPAGWVPATFVVSLAIGTSLAAQAISTRVGLGWLYDLPPSARRGLNSALYKSRGQIVS